MTDAPAVDPGGTPPSLFDANAALGPRHPAAADLPVTRLRELMGRFGIDRCLVHGGWAKWNDVMAGNDRLLREVDGDPSLVPCAVVIPAGAGETPPEEDYVDRLLGDGFRAARLCPNAHRLSLVATVVEPLCAALAARRMPLLLDLDVRHWSEPRPWGFIEWVAGRFPELPLVLVRESQAGLRTLLPFLDRFSNLVVETSYFQANNGLRLLTDRVGASRLCFGSGLPEWDPGPPVNELLLAELTAPDRRLIAGDSLQNLLDGCLL